MKFPVALQVYSIREEAERDFALAMARVKQMGYDGVELAGTYGMSAVQIREILDSLGLALVCAHVPLDDMEKEEVLADYQAAGMKYIAIPWLTGPKNERELAAALERIRRAGERCREHGMQLLYHNHDFEFEKIGGEYILDTYYSRIPAQLLQTELDVCWVNVGGEEPSGYVRRYAGRAPIVHLKDFAGSKAENMYALIGSDAAREDSAGRFEFRPVGCGVQDFPAILAAAEDAGAQWVVVEQDSPSMGKTALECAEMSIQYLRSL